MTPWTVAPQAPLSKNTRVGCHAMPSSRGFFQLRDRTCISCLAGRYFTTESPGKSIHSCYLFPNQCSVSNPIIHDHFKTVRIFFSVSWLIIFTLRKKYEHIKVSRKLSRSTSLSPAQNITHSTDNTQHVAAIKALTMAAFNICEWISSESIKKLLNEIS